MNSFQGSNEDFINRLTEIIIANYHNEDFKAIDLAKKSGIPLNYLRKRIKAVKGKTIPQFINEIRLQKALEYVRQGNLTASEIAYKTGFGSPSYFNKCFHEYFGYSPGDIKNHIEDEEQEIQHVVNPREKFYRKKTLISLIVILIVAIPLSVFLIHKSSHSKIEKSVAVLPFNYLGEETEKQFQADGMMNILQSYLSKIYDLRVISVTSVEQYRNTEKTAITIGQELDVAYLIEGRLLKDCDQYKLILQLINAKDDSHVWATEYDGDRETISGNLTFAAEQIIAKLNAKITPEEKQGIRKVQTTNFSALDFYQVGKSKLGEYNPFDRKPELLNAAQVSFNKSLQCDSSYSLSYAGLAEIYWIRYGWSDKNKDKYLDSVLFLTNQALFYDDRCADAYVFRSLYYNESGKKKQALNDAEKAMKCNPNDKKVYTNWFDINQDYNNVDNWIKSIAGYYEVIKRFRDEDLGGRFFWLSWTYDQFGFYELSKKCTLQKLELDQDSGSFFYHMQWVEFNAAHFEEAYRYAKKCCEFDSTFLSWESIQYYTFSGHDKEAYEYAKRCVEHAKKTGNSLRLLHRVAYAYWKAGKTEEAREFYNQELQNYFNIVKQRELEGIKEEEGYNIATSIDYAMLGEKEKAFKYIIYTKEMGTFPRLAIILLKYDPAYNEIREDPRFQKVLQEFETQFQAKHDKLKKWLEEQGYL